MGARGRIGREEILRFVRERAYRPLRFEELAAALGVDREGKEAFAQELAALEAEGLVVRTRQQRYAAPERLDLIVGRVHGHRRGFAFLVPEWPQTEDLHLSAENLHGAMHGDRVLVRRVGVREGEVVRVLRRANERVVGRVEGQGTFVRPLDSRLAQDIVLPRGPEEGVRDGDVVVVEITRWPDGRRPPLGRVVERLGRAGDPGVDIEAICRKYGLPQGFPEEVVRAAERLPTRVRPQDLKGRRDLRGLLVVTIDSEDAKDLDDAVSLEVRRGVFRLGVHIADVSYYVREGSAIDQEASRRATSVYLVDRVIPMLPERLSNGICSLNPRVDRLTLSLFLEFDAEGRLLRHELFPAVIHSAMRLSYDRVNQALAGDAQAQAELGRVLPMLRQMNRLKDILRARRERRGSIDFEFSEQKVILDERGRPVRIVERGRTAADQLIEEFMLAANETIARLFAEQGVPFLYRVHEEMDPERQEALRAFLAHFGYALPPGHVKLEPHHLQAILARAKGRPEEQLIQQVVLRSLKRARYAATNLGHFGLAAAYYTHFTSPIRRYPDLVVHRIVRELIAKGRLSPRRRAALEAVLPQLADHCSEQERRAEEAERESVELKKVEFMLDKVGQTFPGTVSGVTSFGFFVQLDLGVEGLVRLSSLTDDYYHFDERLYTLTGERTGRRFRLGDRVMVRVARVDPGEREIDLVLVEERRRPRRSRSASRRRKAAHRRAR